MIEVGALADLLLDRLGLIDPQLAVGDNLAPHEGGWLEGQPNVKAFRPYVVLMQGPTTPAAPDRMVPSHSEWMVNYSVRTYAGSPLHLRTWTQKVRNGLDLIKGDSFGVTDVFKIVHTHFDQLGSIVRNDAVDPPYWQAFDAIRVEASRSRNQP